MFKVGDRVKLERSCSYMKAGEIGVLNFDKDNKYDTDLYAGKSGVLGCSCRTNWIKIDEATCEKPEGSVDIFYDEAKCNEELENIDPFYYISGTGVNFGGPPGEMFIDFAYLNNNLKEKHMSLVSKFKHMLMSEPEKTFREAEILRNDDVTVFTSEGEELFLQFLLDKFGAEFKEKVVDPLIAEQEKK